MKPTQRRHVPFVMVGLIVCSTIAGTTSCKGFTEEDNAYHKPQIPGPAPDPVASAGEISSNPGASMQPSIALDSNGRPAVAWMDRTPGNLEIYLRYWDGQSWQELGGSASAGGISSSRADSWAPAVAFTSDDKPVVAWLEGSPGITSILIRRWNGHAWQTVGGPLGHPDVAGTRGNLQTPVLALDLAGNPLVAWSGWTGRRWDSFLRRRGGSWLPFGQASGPVSGSDRSSVHPTLVVDRRGHPIIAWSEILPDNAEIYAARWTGARWERISGPPGGAGISANAGDSKLPKLALSRNGEPTVAWMDDTSARFGKRKDYVRGSWQIYLRSRTANGWQQLAGSASGQGISATRGESRAPALALDPLGNPYVAWQDNTRGNDEILLSAWTGTAWRETCGSHAAGGLSANSGSSGLPALAVDTSGSAYVAWNDNTSGNYEIHVKRCD